MQENNSNIICYNEIVSIYKEQSFVSINCVVNLLIKYNIPLVETCKMCEKLLSNGIFIITDSEENDFALFKLY